MYQALYRKYRPQNFASVVAQDSVKKILINAIKNNKISHAYLFAGPRGIGKTSIAKIFAKAVNCLNFTENSDVCLNCENCKEAQESMDIIEIDAASNNGVDQIRELKSKVNIVPSKLKYKVYIIDEVHMLSNSAFNALLKTLEEPPSHVIFILATTEFYEVPETIVSRCMCFNFDRISDTNLKNRLRFIADKENINVDDECLLEIAHYASGGLRDAIGMLDKLTSFTEEKITIDDFISLNGLISQNDIINTYNNLIEKNYQEILLIIKKIDDNGYSFQNFIEKIMLLIKDKVIDYYNNPKKDFSLKDNILMVNHLNNLLNTLKTSLNPLVMLQVGFLELISLLSDKKEIDDSNINNLSKETIIKKETNEINKVNENKENKKNASKNITINERTKEIRINNALATANLEDKNLFLSNWTKLNDYKLNDKYAKTVQLLSTSTPVIVGKNDAVLASKLTSSTNRMYEIYENIDNIITEINNRKYHLVYITEKEFEIVKNKYINDKKNGIIYEYQEETESLVIKEKKENQLLDKAINIFGSDLVDYEEE